MSTLKLGVPVVAPPASPEPAAVVIPSMSPAEPGRDETVIFLRLFESETSAIKISSPEAGYLTSGGGPKASPKPIPFRPPLGMPKATAVQGKTGLGVLRFSLRNLLPQKAKNARDAGKGLRFVGIGKYGVSKEGIFEINRRFSTLLP